MLKVAVSLFKLDILDKSKHFIFERVKVFYHRWGFRIVLKPNVSFVVGSVGFIKWKAFHRMRRRNDSVLSIKHVKYSLGRATGIFLVEYPMLTGSISIRRVLDSKGA